MQGPRGRSTHKIRTDPRTTTIPTNTLTTPHTAFATAAATSYHPDEAIFDNTNSFSPMYTSASQSSFGSVNSVTNLQPSVGGYWRIPEN